MARSWGLTVLMLACGAALAATLFADGLTTLGMIEVVVFAAIALVFSPLVFPPSVGATQARRRSAGDGRPIVYWRPGCRYCLRLRMRVGRAGQHAHWVNIWTDPIAAAAVRAAAGGNETVPTVVIGELAVVNPDPKWLQDRLVQASGRGHEQISHPE